MKFTALLHHLTVDLLRESFYSLKRKAAPGVDGVTWYEYETGLEDRLVDLHGRVHRGAFQAMPSRRVYIEKEDGRQRPLGIAALEEFIDSLGGLWFQGKLNGKAASAFTSTAGPHGGNETTVVSLYIPIAHLGFIIVPTGYTHEKVVQGHGTPYGSSSISGQNSGPAYS